MALTIVAAAAVAVAFTATLILPSSIALTALIVSSVALGLLCVGHLYPIARKVLPSALRRIVDIIRAQVVEFFSIAALICFKVHDLEKKNPKKVDPNCGQPILLVHGYFGCSSSWTYMHHRLKSAGLGPVFSINLGSIFQSIDGDYAEKVKEKAEEIAKITGRKDLILVGHSMGGLISSYYAENLAPKGSVTDVITLGSPLHGTKLAPFGFGECAKQMDPNSPFIKDLHEKIYNSEYTRYFNMSSNADEVILPNNSALLDKTKMKKLKTHTFENLGHASYPLSDRVADKLVKYIQKHQTAACAA